MTEKQKLYVVTADTYQESWGSEIDLILVTDDKKAADKEYHRLKEGCNYPIISEVQLNTATTVYLGGYCE